MMNIRNLGSQQSTGVKYADGICAKFCLKIWLESGWYYFCNITCQDGFKCDPETEFQTITS